MSSEPQPPRYIPPSRRRDKPILSCSLCRRRKLKCDRQQPCKACVDRGLSLSCTFSRTPHPPAANSEPKAPNNVHDRIDQLEKLVTTLMEEKRNDNQYSPASLPTTGHSFSPNLSNRSPETHVAGTPERVNLETDETTYTNSGHWTSILDGIAELKEHLDEISTTQQGPDPRNEVPGPDLLFGRQRHATQEEILAGFPSRQQTDQLVVRFFAHMDMAPTLIHRPTFLHEYDQFWEKPKDTPVMWVGLLYAIIAIATRFQLLSDGYTKEVPTPVDFTYSSASMDFYREKVVQCLTLANYAKCPPYTMETLLSYFVLEYSRSRDTQFGIWLLVGMLVRTAFRMGMHREPSIFSNITPFKAEMRRRTWSMIEHLDLMSSVQVGLPRMIQPSMFDTKEPRSLNDTDLDPNMTELPPSKPHDEPTPMLFAVFRNRVLHIIARVMDLTNTNEQPAYREVLELDAILRNTYDTIPPSLRSMKAREFEVESEFAVRRLYLALTYLKTQMMLHRPFLLLGRTDSRYEYSRIACLDSAIEILAFQKLLDSFGSQTDTRRRSTHWQLWETSWRQSSLVNHDFLLATTVLSLDLDRDLVSPIPESKVPRVRFTRGQPTRTEIVESLTGIYDIWVRGSEKSREAAKAAAAVKLVLGKVKAAEHPSREASDSPSQGDTLNIFPQAHPPDLSMDVTAMPPLFDINNPQFSPPFPMGDIPMEFGGSFDWAVLDSQYPLPSFEQNAQNPFFS